MSRFQITIEDVYGETPEDDFVDYSVIITEDDEGRPENEGFSNGIIQGAQLIYLMDHPDLIMEALKDVPLEEIFLLEDKKIVELTA